MQQRKSRERTLGAGPTWLNQLAHTLEVLENARVACLPASTTRVRAMDAML